MKDIILIFRTYPTPQIMLTVLNVTLVVQNDVQMIQMVLNSLMKMTSLFQTMLKQLPNKPTMN